jgi:hypothetical protein
MLFVYKNQKLRISISVIFFEIKLNNIEPFSGQEHFKSK